MAGLVPAIHVFRAFSSEVDTGSRQENATKTKTRSPGFDSIKTEVHQAVDARHKAGHDKQFIPAPGR
jgi:hypothetical protein